MLRDGRKESNKVDDMGDVSEGSKHTSSTGQADAILEVSNVSKRVRRQVGNEGDSVVAVQSSTVFLEGWK